ncbi:MAG: putative DNA-binding transcriptional regulator YafY [Planctomycetota bacterium]|jgi:predicted DNA-binding transcriptional regulator YafY
MAYENNRNNDNRNGGQRNKMHYSPNLLGCINNALENQKIATLEYESRDFEVSKRDIEPMALIYKNRKRQLVAYCHLREEYRTFRLDRINLIKVNNKEFTPREGFDVTLFEGDDENQDWHKDSQEN